MCRITLRIRMRAEKGAKRTIGSHIICSDLIATL